MNDIRSNTIQRFLDILSEKVVLKRSKHNHKIYHSEECPFCGEKSKKGNNVFRYNTKFKVGKSYCCGVSFKDLSWLKKRLDPNFDFDLFEMDNKYGLYENWSDEKIEDYKNFLDTLSMKVSRIEKSNQEDDNFPF